MQLLFGYHEIMHCIPAATGRSNFVAYVQIYARRLSQELCCLFHYVVSVLICKLL